MRVVALIAVLATLSGTDDALFSESFEDDQLPARGWYDGGKLKLSAEVKSGATAIPAGEYTIGVIKTSDKDWTMALYPGAPARGVPVDTAKVIKIDSMLESGKGTAEHMLVDLTPGHGKFEGKAVLTLHFGTLFLSGLLG